MATCALAQHATSTGTTHAAMAFLTTFSSISTLFRHWYTKKVAFLANQFVRCQKLLKEKYSAKRFLIEFKFV